MTQPTREEALAHFGVKGMRWGVRNAPLSVSSDTPKRKISNKKKVAIGAGVLAVGTVVTLSVLAKQGNLPIKDISMSLPSKTKNLADVLDLDQKSRLQATNRGAKKVKQLSNTDTFKKLMKDFDADIAEAHKQETAWMLKNVPTYVPRIDPYIPDSELERLRTG